MTIPQTEVIETSYEPETWCENWVERSVQQRKIDKSRPPIFKWNQPSIGNKYLIQEEAELDWVTSFLVDSICDEEMILSYEGDPEDENFIPVSKETLERAKRFVRPYISHSPTSNDVRILPGPDGSVDIHWKNGKRELLLNVPAAENEPASFYGDDYGKIRIKGTIDLDSIHPSVLGWLINS